MKLIREKTFYKSLLAITVPIVLQNLINVGVSMLDTVMLAGLNQSALSASMLANQLYFILVVAFFGVAGGASVLTAQYWGKKDTKAIRRILGMSLRYAVIIAALFAAAAIFAPRVVMQIYTNNENLITLGASYLRIIGFSYILSAVTVVYLGILRSTGNVRVATAVYSLSMVVNGVFNYLLIFGAFGFPEMGIEGAALATLIARVCEIVFVSFYALAKEKQIRFKLKYFFYRNRTLFRDFLRFSAPVILNELAWSTGFSMQSAVLGHMSEAAVAANSIISVVSRLVTVGVFGMANASAVMIGNEVGRGREESAKNQARTMLIISLGLGIISSGLILLIRAFMPAFAAGVQLTPAALSLLMKMMLTSALYILFHSFNGTNIIGVLRGGGDSRFGMILDAGVLWFTSLLLGPLCGFVLKIPVEWVFFVMMLDEPIKFLPGILRFRSGRWLRNVTRNDDFA